jgi:uncharacterized protein (DUF2141 family)
MLAVSMALISSVFAQVSVKLTVTGFHNNEGRLLLAVFNNLSQFPYEPFLEFAWEKDTVSGSNMIIDFDLPAEGSYAFSVLDDKNSNGEMDKNFIGLPQEHFGFSNNARPVIFSPPEFEDCLVKILPGINDLEIILQRY